MRVILKHNKMAFQENNTWLNLTLNASHLTALLAPASTGQEAANRTMYVFDLGPKRDSLSSVIPITVVYVALLITGLVGNICTCFVIVRNKHMHTATNYYLFNLAVSDLLLLVVGLPQELYLLWNKYPYIFGEAFCIIRGFTSEMSTNASILTIAAFTFERYLAICHPIKSHTTSKLSRVIKIIFINWISSGVIAIPLAIQFGVVYKYFEEKPVYESAECTIKKPIEHTFAASTVLFFLLPMAMMSVLYGFIGMRLRTPSSTSQDCEEAVSEYPATLNGSGKQFVLKSHHLVKLLKRQSTRSVRGTGASSRKAVIKMLFAVVVAFFLCWAPFHAQRLMAIYVQHQTPTVVIVYTVLTYISGVTYYVSATINPILYSIMSNKFRQAFKDTLAHCCRENTHYSRSSSRYNSYLTHRSSVLRSNQSTVTNNNSSQKKKRSGSLDQVLNNSAWKNTANNNTIPTDNLITRN